MVGQYRIEKPLGRGGMGEVYAAIHPVIGKRVALKVIRWDRVGRGGHVERFVQEARAVNLIGHPNIVDVFAFAELPDGRPYLAMELLTGVTLRERLDRGPMELSEILHVADGVLGALQAAHEQGIVHRDLKPENVFLVEKRAQAPVVKLLDFGLAKLTDERDLRADRTASGILLGTPRYLAPEQAAGGAVVPRTDLYAFGVMLFEMSTGQPPFVGANAIELIAHHLSTPAPRMRSIDPEVPEPLEELASALLAKAPEDRPSLQRVRSVLQEVAREAETRLRQSAPSRRRWTIPAALALLGAALTLSWWLATREHGRAVPIGERGAAHQPALAPLAPPPPRPPPTMTTPAPATLGSAAAPGSATAAPAAAPAATGPSPAAKAPPGPPPAPRSTAATQAKRRAKPTSASRPQQRAPADAPTPVTSPSELAAQRGPAPVTRPSQQADVPPATAPVPLDEDALIEAYEPTGAP